MVARAQCVHRPPSWAPLVLAVVSEPPIGTGALLVFLLAHTFGVTYGLLLFFLTDAIHSVAIPSIIFRITLALLLDAVVAHAMKDSGGDDECSRLRCEILATLLDILAERDEFPHSPPHHIDVIPCGQRHCILLLFASLFVDHTERGRAAQLERRTGRDSPCCEEDIPDYHEPLRWIMCQLKRVAEWLLAISLLACVG